MLAGGGVVGGSAGVQPTNGAAKEARTTATIKVFMIFICVTLLQIERFHVIASLMNANELLNYAFFSISPVKKI